MDNGNGAMVLIKNTKIQIQVYISGHMEKDDNSNKKYKTTQIHRHLFQEWTPGQRRWWQSRF